MIMIIVVFFFKQKTAYVMRISDWSLDVCSSDLFTLLFLPLLSFGQQKRIEGIVKDVDGPLPGVTIIEKSRPMNGVATNENGEFSFTFTGEAPHTLIFRFVGFVEQELTVTSEGWLEVIMQPNTQELEIGRASCRERVCQYV